MTTEKCPNPNCKDGWITDAVACCICEGKIGIAKPFNPAEFPNCVYCYHRPHHVDRARFNDDGLCPVGVAFSCFGPRKSRENCDCSPCRCGECIAKLDPAAKKAVLNYIGWPDNESDETSGGK